MQPYKIHGILFDFGGGNSSNTFLGEFLAFRHDAFRSCSPADSEKFTGASRRIFAGVNPTRWMLINLTLLKTHLKRPQLGALFSVCVYVCMYVCM